MMLGADFYETDAEVASLLAEGRVPVGIGENTKIKYEQLKPICHIVETKYDSSTISRFSLL